MSTSANFAATPRVGIGQVSVANTNRDGTGTIVSVLAAGSSGARIARIVVQATGTTTAGQVRLFLHDGTNARLWKEVAIRALTPSATVQAEHVELTDQSDLGLMPLILPSGWSLHASTHNAETFNVIAYGADF